MTPTHLSVEDLKPCPLCESEGRVIWSGFVNFVQCASCGAQGPQFNRGQWRDPETAARHAARAWNKRPPLDALERSQPEGVSAWRPIDDQIGHAPVLVSRPADKYLYGPVKAFRDVTGAWLVADSHHEDGGMATLGFEPTHYRPLPEPMSMPALSSQPDRTEEGECPTCGSPDPKLHPAVQCGGEVSPCSDAYHTPARPEVSSEGVRERIADIADHLGEISRELGSRKKEEPSWRLIWKQAERLQAVVSALSSGNGLGGEQDPEGGR